MIGDLFLELWEMIIGLCPKPSDSLKVAATCRTFMGFQNIDKLRKELLNEYLNNDYEFLGCNITHLASNWPEGFIEDSRTIELSNYLNNSSHLIDFKELNEVSTIEHGYKCYQMDNNYMECLDIELKNCWWTSKWHIKCKNKDRTFITHKTNTYATIHFYYKWTGQPYKVFIFIDKCLFRKIAG